MCCYYFGATGKFWSVEHDVAKLDVWRPGQRHDQPPFEGTFDYIFYSANELSLCAVREPLTDAQYQSEIVQKGTRLPCEWHMSDHLPMAACFTFKV